MLRCVGPLIDMNRKTRERIENERVKEIGEVGVEKVIKYFQEMCCNMCGVTIRSIEINSLIYTAFIIV